MCLPPILIKQIRLKNGILMDISILYLYLDAYPDWEQAVKSAVLFKCAMDVYTIFWPLLNADLPTIARMER